MKFSLLKLSACMALIFPLAAHATGSNLLNPSDIAAAMAAYKMAYQEDLGHESCFQVLMPNWFIADRRFGSAKIVAQTMNYLLPEIEGGDELLRVFKLASSNSKEFRDRLDTWLFEHGRMRAITLSELKAYLAQNVDFPIFDSSEDEAKGFISYKAYTFAVAHGLFPMGDPHDIFFHLPAFLDRRFGGSLARIAKLIYETADRQEHRALAVYLRGVMRDIGVENWSYIVHESAYQPLLFLQGNRPFFAINGFAGRLPQEESTLLSFMNTQGRGFSVYDFRQFPKWQIFAQGTTAATILKELEPLLGAVEIPRDSLEEVSQSWESQFTGSVEVSDFLPRLAAFINRDPLLQRAYSSETRGRSAQLLLDLMEAYWLWIQNNTSSDSVGR